MKRNTFILGAFLFINLVFAQQKSITSQVLDTLQITSFNYHNKLPFIPKTIQVIKIKEIQLAPIESLDDLLELIAGIDVRTRGSKGVQSDISIRGGNFDQVLILLNGVRINNPQTGHHNLDLPVDFSMLDHVEILEGASGQSFGANAFSGAINLVTKNPKKEQAQAVLKAGQFGYTKTTLDLAHAIGRLSIYNAFSFQRSDGYLTHDSINNTDFYGLKDYAHIHYEGKNFPVDLQAGFHQKDFGANSFYTSKYPWQFEKTKGYFAALSSQMGQKIKIKPGLHYNLNFDEFQLFRESVYQYQNGFFIHDKDTAQYAPGLYYTGHNYHKTRQIGADVNMQFKTKLGQSYAHLSWENEKIWSNKLGEPLASPIIIDSRTAYTKSAGRTYYEAGFDHHKKWKKWTFGGGLSILLADKFDAQINGDGFVNYQWSHLISYFHISSASRLPTFTDLYYQGPDNIGNPDLKPEKSYTYELGAKFWLGNTRLNSSVFLRQSRQTIDWVKFDITDKWQPQNLTDLQTFGIEMSFKHYFKHKLLKNCNLSYAYLDMTKSDTQNFISKYVLDYLKHKFTLQLAHRFVYNSTLNWVGIYKDRNGQYLDYIDGAYNLFDYKPYFLTNVKWHKQWQKTRLSLTIENVFDITYRDLSYIKMPGRWFIIELHYQIK